VPAEAVHRFPAGLKDYLAREIDGKELVADGVFAGSAWSRRPRSSATRIPLSWVPPSGVGMVLQ
jgi:hypothetical protein